MIVSPRASNSGVMRARLAHPNTRLFGLSFISVILTTVRKLSPSAYSPLHPIAVSDLLHVLVSRAAVAQS